jgi:hypothetical protein
LILSLDDDDEMMMMMTLLGRATTREIVCVCVSVFI